MSTERNRASLHYVRSGRDDNFVAGTRFCVSRKGMTKGSLTLRWERVVGKTAFFIPLGAAKEMKKPRSSNYFLWNRCPLLCHPERSRISYFTALTATTYVVLLKENHTQLTEATTLDRKSGGAEGSAVPRTFPENAEPLPATKLSSRPERTRISCHAALEITACAAFSKESRMKIVKTTNTNRKSGVA